MPRHFERAGWLCVLALTLWHSYRGVSMQSAQALTAGLVVLLYAAMATARKRPGA